MSRTWHLCLGSTMIQDDDQNWEEINIKPGVNIETE